MMTIGYDRHAPFQRWKYDESQIAILFLFCVCGHAWGQTLKRVAAIDLPGSAGERFDYLTIDYEDHYVLSAHLGPGILYVIDTRTNRLVKAILGVPEITGLEYVPGLKKVFTSDRGENKVGVVDLKQMRITGKIDLTDKPNGSTYAEPFGKMYVSTYGTQEAIIDVYKDVLTKSLQVPGTGMPQYDSVGRKVYVNLHNGEIAEIDPASDTVLGKYTIPNCERNHGLALDANGRRAFVLCNGNRSFVFFDLDGHRAVADIPLPAGSDVVKFDPGLKRVYVACTSGAISVIQEDDPDHFRKLEDFPVETNVHSLAVDAETHRVYAPEEEEKGKPVSRMVIYEAVTK
jgi:DNA-binding beta-propeller fold protein YncE